MTDRTRTAFALVNGRDHSGRSVSMRLQGDRIVDVGCEPAAHDRVLDLQGDRVLPGLINAHDHLQLNHFPPLTNRSDYRNASEWIADIQARRLTDTALQAATAIDRRTRLLVGGVKNLLSGVTTVAHHDPCYEPLRGNDFPVRVVARYGWSHSLFVDGDEQVRAAHALSPDDAPWILHAGEGVDATAAMEFARLTALGCVSPKTLLVHGVAFTREERRALAERGAGLIWCPGSNLNLFGQAASIDEVLPRSRVAIGTDSRLSGSRDLLDELRVASAVARLDESMLETLVTSNAASLLRLPDRGAIQCGQAADIAVLPRNATLSSSTRGDVRLVICRGVPVYGDAAYMEALAPERWSAIRVDGAAKALDRQLCDSLRASGITEPGLDLRHVAWRAA